MAEVWAALLSGSPYALLALVVVALILGWLIPRSTHREARADRDAYKTAALTALQASEKMGDNVERLTTAVGQLSAVAEQQIALQRETLALVQRLVPPDRSAA